VFITSLNMKINPILAKAKELSMFQIESFPMLNRKKYRHILFPAFCTLAMVLFAPANSIASPSGTASYQTAGSSFDAFTHLENIGILGLDSNRHVFDIPLLAVGQVTSIDLDSSTILVNGQDFIIDEVTTTYDSSGATTSTNTISLGEYVSIAGEVAGPGIGLATLIQRLPTAYVSGSSYAYSRIIIENTDAISGNVNAGNATVDIQNALFNPNLSRLTSGDIAEFIGFTTDATKNILIALSGNEISNQLEINQLQGVRGTGLRGVRGTGLRGVRGTGLRGVRGTGLRGVRGTGLRGVRGTGLRGVRGTGLRGVRGTGLRGVRGTGLR
jgi:hypothetical protein